MKIIQQLGKEVTIPYPILKIRGRGAVKPFFNRTIVLGREKEERLKARIQLNSRLVKPIPIDEERK